MQSRSLPTGAPGLADVDAVRLDLPVDPLLSVGRLDDAGPRCRRGPRARAGRRHAERPRPVVGGPGDRRTRAGSSRRGGAPPERDHPVDAPDRQRRAPPRACELGMVHALRADTDAAAAALDEAAGAVVGILEPFVYPERVRATALGHARQRVGRAATFCSSTRRGRAPRNCPSTRCRRSTTFRATAGPPMRSAGSPNCSRRSKVRSSPATSSRPKP